MTDTKLQIQNLGQRTLTRINIKYNTKPYT